MIEVEELETLKKIVVDRVTEQLGDPNLNACKLLNALAELTVHDASEPDIGWNNAKYHATRLAVELGNAKNDSDKDRRYINRIWKDMIEAYEVIEASIENDVRKAGFRKILKPRKTDPKTGRVEFYLGVEEIDTVVVDEKLEASDKQRGVINYHLAKLPKPNFLAKHFQILTLDSPKFWLYMAILVVPIISMLVWFEYLLITRAYSSLLWFALGVVVLFAAWLIISPFYNLNERKISMAPMWMLNLRTLNAQIEMKKKDGIGALGKPVRELVLVVYEGECPICGGHVDIVQGKRQHKDRLIGQCSNNGVEHIFSFDQVTKKGVPLRFDTYTTPLIMNKTV